MYYFYRSGNKKNNAGFENFWEKPHAAGSIASLLSKKSKRFSKFHCKAGAIPI
jgi:hypothetical protein